MREVAIAETGLDDQKRLFVRPTGGDFEHVYRAAMDVYWDRSARRLSYRRTPLDWTPVRCFQQIKAAVADEYGVLLKLTGQNIWINMSTDLRSLIEAAAYTNGN